MPSISDWGWHSWPQPLKHCRNASTIFSWNAPTFSQLMTSNPQAPQGVAWLCVEATVLSGAAWCSWTAPLDLTILGFATQEPVRRTTFQSFCCNKWLQIWISDTTQSWSTPLPAPRAFWYWVNCHKLCCQLRLKLFSGSKFLESWRARCSLLKILLKSQMFVPVLNRNPF